MKNIWVLIGLKNIRVLIGLKTIWVLIGLTTIWVLIGLKIIWVLIGWNWFLNAEDDEEERESGCFACLETNKEISFLTYPNLDGNNLYQKQKKIWPLIWFVSATYKNWVLSLRGDIQKFNWTIFISLFIIVYFTSWQKKNISGK